MINRWFTALVAKYTRRFIRYRLQRLKTEKLLQSADKLLLKAFKRAASTSQAYQCLLAEHNIDVRTIGSAREVVSQCPVLDKTNTFSRFSLKQLTDKNISVSQFSSVLTSSGYGSSIFAIGLSTFSQHARSASLIDLGLELAFEIDRYQTLVINCLPMGVVFQSDTVCVANVSVREDMACGIIEQMGPWFEQIILCGDPLYLKKLCDYSQIKKLNWTQYKMRVIIGEEMFSETFRDYLAQTFSQGQCNSGQLHILSSMGVAELGLNLFTETEETVLLKRRCIENKVLADTLLGPQLHCSGMASFMVYSPLRSFVEVINQDVHGVGDLVITMLDLSLPIPLIRYQTGDRAKVISRSCLETCFKKHIETIPLPRLPILALFGRSKEQLPNGLHVNHYKHILYLDSVLARDFSGAFTLLYTGNVVIWEVQLVINSELFEETVALRLYSLLPIELQSTQIIVKRYEDFHHSKTLDYERKFTYYSQ